MVLVDSLGRTAVILHVHFWLNGREHSWLKVRSSVIRLVKLAFQKHGLSMPDEAREVVFPKQSSVTMPPEARGDAPSKPPEVPISTDSPHEDPNAVSTKAEAGLYSESVVIEEQARKVQPLKDGENLLQSASADPSSKRQGT